MVIIEIVNNSKNRMIFMTFSKKYNLFDRRQYSLLMYFMLVAQIPALRRELTSLIRTVL